MLARAATEAEAASLAVSHLGQPGISDLADNSLRARAARQFFAAARDALLREKWWSFAKGWVTPAADSADSLGPLAKRYVMPVDCLRVRYINGVQDEQWDIESGQVDSAGVQVEAVVLVTNVVAPLVAYTRRVEAPRLWDSVFLLGFSYELASMCALKLGRSSSKRDALHAQAMVTIDSAAQIDSKEQSRQTQGPRLASVLRARTGFRSR